MGQKHYWPATHKVMTLSKLREYLEVYGHLDTLDNHFTPLIKWIQERASASAPPFHMHLCTPAFVMRSAPSNIGASLRSIVEAFRFLEYPKAGRYHINGLGYFDIYLTRACYREDPATGEIDPVDYRHQWDRDAWQAVIKQLNSEIPKLPRRQYPPRNNPKPKAPSKLSQLKPKAAEPGQKPTHQDKLAWFNSPEQVEKRRKREAAKRRKARDITLTSAKIPKRIRRKYVGRNTFPVPPSSFDVKLDKEYWKVKMQILRLQQQFKKVPKELEYRFAELSRMKQDDNGQR